MPDLPYTRVVNVTLTRQDSFPARTGFGVPLILSDVVSDVTAGAVDATTLTKTYGTLAEVAADWGTATGAYLAAQRIFSQPVTPLQIKIGYCDATAITAGLDLIEVFDNGWYWLVPVSTGAWLDVAAAATEFANWTEARSKQCFLQSYDANTENAADTTNIAYVVQQLNVDRTSVMYHDVTGTQLHAAVAAYGATRNFDDVDSAYTMKFKGLSGIPVVDKGSAAVQAVTGFVPGLGLDATQGFFANTYVDIGGVDHLTEGSTSSGAFIDEVHFSDWIIARTQEAILGLFATVGRVPYTDKGFNQVAQVVQGVLGAGRNAGAIADFENTDGFIVPWSVTVPRVAGVPVAQRRQRIMPAMQAQFRYAGAVHYTTVNYTMTF